MEVGGSGLARLTSLHEISCVKNYRSIPSIAVALGLTIAAFAQADTNWQTDYKKAQEEAKEYFSYLKTFEVVTVEEVKE